MRPPHTNPRQLPAARVGRPRWITRRRSVDATGRSTALA